ncbi:MAG: ABC transporter permease [Chloroflexi bacterium]|nr:ABC transporter permease [Chloroflexota bacterium]
MNLNWADALKAIFTLTLLTSTIRVSISIILAGMGEMLTERSGVLNIGVEGTMLMGALAAALGSYFTGSPWIGLIAAGLTGMLIGLLFSFIAITLRSNQSITGLAIYLLCVGLSGYLLQIIFEHGGNSPKVNTLPMLHFAFLEKIPLLNAIFNDQSAIVIPVLLLPIIMYVLFYRTPWGSWLRAAGENPKALAVVGKNPVRIRYVATLCGSFLAGIGGAYLSISQTSLFSENMVAGRGFIALSAVIFGGVRPFGVFLACVFFGFMDALQKTLQTVIPDTIIPRELFMSLPYLLTLLVLAGFIKKSGGPADIGNPYLKESR